MVLDRTPETTTDNVRYCSAEPVIDADSAQDPYESPHRCT